MGRLMTIAVTTLLVTTALLALFWTLQRRLMYFPMSGVPAPSELGLQNVEPVRFKTSDGLELEAWFFGRSGPPGPTVLVFNGNAGNRAYRAPLATVLRQQGFQVLLFDYRGYGDNPGRPTASGLARDARAAQAYLAGRSDVDRSRMVYFGESLGTAVAVDLAVEHPPAALVLRSPFTSMTDLGQLHYPFLPIRFLLRDRFAAIDQIRRVQAPILVIAGGRDRIVPIENSRRLYAAATAPKELLVLPDADHNDHELLAGDEMIEAVVRFLNR
jgi:fermentation-respiration switch protein FrsA (DUF1100 family)